MAVSNFLPAPLLRYFGETYAFVKLFSVTAYARPARPLLLHSVCVETQLAVTCVLRNVNGRCYTVMLGICA